MIGFSFRFRHLVSLMMFCGFAIMSLSGIFLFAAPRSSDWNFLSLGLRDWEGIHVVFGFVFIISGLFHIWFNQGSIVSYLRNRITTVVSVFSFKRLKPEPFVALLLCAFLMASAVKHFPPATYLGTLHKAISNMLQPSSDMGDDDKILPQQ